MSDSFELFGKDDFDQKALEREAALRPPVVIEKRTEESEVKSKPSVMPTGKKLYIIDGYGLIYRSYYGFFNNPMKDTKGNNVSAVYGFFTTVLKIMREYKPDYLVVAMDSKGLTFRHEMYPAYKANRDAAPEDLHAQVPLINDILKAMDIPSIAMIGVEADDIIATLSEQATRHGVDTIMFTGDKDLLQLVDEHTFALRPAKKNEKFYKLWGEKEVVEEFGITPKQMVDYLTLLGDASDNVPGVKGIGEKGAAKLLQQFDSLDGIYANLRLCSKGIQAKLEEGKESAKLSKTLIQLRDDLFEVDSFDTSQYLLDDVDYSAAIPLFEGIGMKSLARDLERISGSVKPVATQKVTEEPKAAASEMVSAEKGSYEAVTSLPRLKELLALAEKESALMAFDLETTSIDSMVAIPIGFSFSWKEKIAYYVPLVSEGKRLFTDDAIRSVLNDYLPNGRIAIVGQNIKYDYEVLVNWGVRPKRVVFDTMVAAWLLDSTGVFNMDYLSEKYLGYKTIHYTDIVPKGKLLSDLPQDLVVAYGAEDSDITWRLYNLFKELLVARDLYRLMEEVEMPLLLIIANMEMNGIFLDRTLLEPLTEEFEKRLAETEAKVFEICGHVFNLNSPKQLQEVLFVEREIPTGAKTKSGFSTSTDVLEPLAETYEEVALVLHYRMLSKLKNTYIDKLPLQINEKTGRIHPSFSQTGTETGRLSCKDPNLQNIPVRTEEGRRIRSSFVPKKGCIFLSADYSQIELVVLAHMADDPGLKDAFANGVDVHRATAALIFNVPFEQVSSDQRRIAKTINFGVMYGMSAHSLAMDLQIPHTEAKQFIQQYFERYSAVQAFVEQTKRKAETDGYVTTILGHVRTINEIHSRNGGERAKAQRISVNTVIQGSAADIMKMAMLRIDSALSAHALQTKLLLQIHDELVFEVPFAELELVKGLVKEAMEGAVKLSIPLKVSMETGENWGDIH
ncbi:DNA polymerase I [Sphaerochaeta pleomorpha str. Grapes]|uniref:DNA polymerase I n=1 Tax=Sphaerochaeta pleomorpha (strain ATCC BAA-1885 / DSM 22778 / Grapes) TaxID=158190 RepID=G8QSP9_SPHPG|nr:DNA polymerase I [Sphaerochaeta pleomorpha]AEV29010.1 DNA polymerase I [Sphaerochaeta pleomorpha str. Grapes]